jgi:hypothetical protein
VQQANLNPQKPHQQYWTFGMKLREVITTAVELIGAICVVAGICSFSVPIGVIVLGVLLIVGGGLAA